MKVISVVLFPADGAIKQKHAVAELGRRNLPCTPVSIQAVIEEMSCLRSKMYSFARNYVCASMVGTANKTMTLFDDEECSGELKRRCVRSIADIRTSLAQDGSVENFAKFFDVAWGQFEVGMSVPWERQLEERFMKSEGLRYDIEPRFSEKSSKHKVRVGCISKVFSVARKRAVKNLQKDAKLTHGRSLRVRRKRGEIDFTLDQLQKRRKPGVFYLWMVVRADGRRVRNHDVDETSDVARKHHRGDTAVSFPMVPVPTSCSGMSTTSFTDAESAVAPVVSPMGANHQKGEGSRVVQDLTDEGSPVFVHLRDQIKKLREVKYIFLLRFLSFCCCIVSCCLTYSAGYRITQLPRHSCGKKNI